MNSILQQLQQHAAALSTPLQAELLNYAIYLEQKAQGKPVPRNQKRECLAEALEQAAALNPYGDIADPVAWQREQRHDQPLSGRNYAD
jgi:predicted LPLAT superfamily acyltransferase